MAEYTLEQVRRIVEGLVSGRRPAHKPMTDAEFLAVYDPSAFRHAQLLEVLEDIGDALLRLPTDAKERPWRPPGPSFVRPLSGPIQLP